MEMNSIEIILGFHLKVLAELWTRVEPIQLFPSILRSWQEQIFKKRPEILELPTGTGVVTAGHIRPGVFPMFKPVRLPLGVSTMSITAILAVIFVGLAVLVPSVPAVKAEPQASAMVALAHFKGDRLPTLTKGAACSSLGWPHYEQACQFDMRRPADEIRAVRVIALR
jgi:hypothetical protein